MYQVNMAGAKVASGGQPPTINQLALNQIQNNQGKKSGSHNQQQMEKEVKSCRPNLYIKQQMVISQRDQGKVDFREQQKILSEFISNNIPQDQQLRNNPIQVSKELGKHSGTHDNNQNHQMKIHESMELTDTHNSPFKGQERAGLKENPRLQESGQI